MHKRQKALFILQLLLAFLSTASILNDVKEDRNFVVSTRNAFYDQFFDSAVERQAQGPMKHKGYLYDAKDLLKSINNSIESYFRMPQTFLNDMELNADVGLKMRIGRMMETAAFDDTAVKKIGETEREYRIKSARDDWMDVVGVKNNKREFLHSLLYLELTFQARTLHRELDKSIVLFDFDVSVKYDMASRGGRVEMTVLVGGNHVGGDAFKSVKAVFKECFMLSLVFFTQIAVVRSTFNTNNVIDDDHAVYNNNKKKKNRRVRNIRGMILQSFNQSIVLETFANFMLAAAVITSISWQLLPREGFGLGRQFARGLNGFGCFLIWIALGRHLKQNPPYDVAWRAASKGFPIILQFAIGSAPLLMAFTCFGVALFSEDTDKFKNLEMGFITLFAMMNGDIIFESARDIKKGIIGHLYIIAFVVVFVYTIISTFVSIMQKAFAEVESEKRKERGFKDANSNVGAENVVDRDRDDVVASLNDVIKDRASKDLLECKLLLESIERSLAFALRCK
jgi:hypothetical protein